MCEAVSKTGIEKYYVNVEEPHISPGKYRYVALRERLRTHKVYTKDQYFYLNYHEFSIKSYVLDVY